MQTVINTRQLMETARALVADDKGLLAMDESNATCNQRFAKLGIPQTAEMRRVWRDLIVTTPGLGGVYIGPADLAYALGLPPNGDTDNALHLATVGRILETCKAHGVPVGIHTVGAAYTRRRLEAGFDFVTVGSDAGFLMRAAAEDLAKVRDLLRPTDPTHAE